MSRSVRGTSPFLARTAMTSTICSVMSRLPKRCISQRLATQIRDIAAKLTLATERSVSAKSRSLWRSWSVYQHEIEQCGGEGVRKRGSRTRIHRASVVRSASSRHIHEHGEPALPPASGDR